MQYMLTGLLAERAKIESLQDELRGELQSAAPEPSAPKPARRHISAAGKAAIAEAQRKRWARQRREAEEEGEPFPAKKKRFFSVAARKRMSAAQKKRHAAAA